MRIENPFTIKYPFDYGDYCGEEVIIAEFEAPQSGLSPMIDGSLLHLSEDFIKKSEYFEKFKPFYDKFRFTDNNILNTFFKIDFALTNRHFGNEKYHGKSSFYLIYGLFKKGFMYYKVDLTINSNHLLSSYLYGELYFLPYELSELEKMNLVICKLDSYYYKLYKNDKKTRKGTYKKLPNLLSFHLKETASTDSFFRYLNEIILSNQNKPKYLELNKEISNWIKEFETSQIETETENKEEELFATFNKREHNLPHQSEVINESRTKDVIINTFSKIDKQGWQYAFVTEQDYNLFTDLLTNFFEYKPYTLPETIIKLKRTCKTKVAKALGEIHKELSNENKLSTDTKYFQLIRVLSHFKEEKEGDLYKALTR